MESSSLSERDNTCNRSSPKRMRSPGSTERKTISSTRQLSQVGPCWVGGIHTLERVFVGHGCSSGREVVRGGIRIYVQVGRAEVVDIPGLVIYHMYLA